jgi:hypothetical protein
VQDFEKLGVFYLGRLYDPDKDQPLDQLLLYDSKDLLTHAVCVGMTGSGKTGLCLSLLEEAAIDGVPALVIDPKGDLSNLLLTFPRLAPEDFQPWVHEDDAQRQNISVAELARQQAEHWSKGLADWGQDGARIERLRAAADFAIYTPGSSAGLPISVLRAFAAPPAAVREDNDLLAERINATVTGILALVGLQSSAIDSREHILLATILETGWRAGQNLDMATLINQIQNPPITKVGVVDLESFFPAKERFSLAMRLNNLLSAPGFSSWLEGEPLDIQALLHAPSGKPRISIFSIAHLDDSQRMFFVSLLLNETLSWMRAQPGSTSLRAVLYMDEIFGYFPPSANPPSKTPLLTLLKQARAFGLGIVLATQNPVDLDYKGLANAGTWFLGRLQTERDKARVIEGLQSATANSGAKFDRARLTKLLSGLKNRIFLMNNVHDDEPVVFEARWAMSYLCGPLTRDQIKRLMEPQKGAAHQAQSPAPAAGSTPAATAPTPSKLATGQQDASAALAAQPPLVPPQIPQFFVTLRSERPANFQLVYRPAVLGLGTVHFADKKLGIDCNRTVCWLADAHDSTGAIDWQGARTGTISEDDLEKSPMASALFAELPGQAIGAKSVAAWQKSFAEALYRLVKIDLLESPSVGLVSKPDESERDFRVRLQQAGREERDRQLDKLRAKYAPKQAQLQERLRRAEQAVAREKSHAREEGVQTIISVGSAVLGAILGRGRLTPSTISKAKTAARGVSRTMKQSSDAGQAEESVEVLREQQTRLDEELRAEATALQAKTDPLTESLQTIALRPKKADVSVRVVALAWLPEIGS